MRRFLAPAWASTLAVGCSLGSSGCSVIGLNIGMSSPRYATAPSVDAVPPGTDVRITHDGTETDGKLAGSDPDGVRLDGQRSIERVRITKVEKKDGSYWLEGLTMGAALDALAIVAVVITVSHFSNMNLPTYSGSSSGPSVRW